MADRTSSGGAASIGGTRKRISIAVNFSLAGV